MRIEKSDNKILLWCSAEEFEQLDIALFGVIRRLPDTEITYRGFDSRILDHNKQIIAVLESAIKQEEVASLPLEPCLEYCPKCKGEVSSKIIAGSTYLARSCDMQYYCANCSMFWFLNRNFPLAVYSK